MDDFRCKECNLKIMKEGENYRYERPGVVVPTKLQEFDTMKVAYGKALCPLCGVKMSKA